MCPGMVAIVSASISNSSDETEPLTPDRCDLGVNLVDKIDIAISGSGPVLDAEVLESAFPERTKLGCRCTMTLERVEQGNGILVRDWKSGGQRGRYESPHEGIEGWLPPGTRVAFSYEG